MMQQITVKTVGPPPAGAKLPEVFATDGTKFKFDPSCLTLDADQCYEVEVEEKEYKGRLWRKIVKATQVASAPSSAVINGTNQRTSAGEAEFIRTLLVAGIGVGALPFASNELRAAVKMLRGLWRETGE